MASPGLTVPLATGDSTNVASMVDLWSDHGFVEFRAGYTLRRDHVLRSYTVKVEADGGQTDSERELLVAVVFDEIEARIDLAIADNRADTN